MLLGSLPRSRAGRGRKNDSANAGTTNDEINEIDEITTRRATRSGVYFSPLDWPQARRHQKSPRSGAAGACSGGWRRNDLWRGEIRRSQLGWRNAVESLDCGRAATFDGIQRRG